MLIQAQNTEGFSRYLAEHGNTICGRHPIAVSFGSVKVRTCWSYYIPLQPDDSSAYYHPFSGLHPNFNT